MICKHCGTEIADKALICYRLRACDDRAAHQAAGGGVVFDRPRRSRLR
jgi:hypothetical protein